MMTLIVPIASDKPEYNRSMPYLFSLDSDGIMLCVKSILGLDLSMFDSVYFSVLKQHSEKFFLKELFNLQFKSLGLTKKAHVYEMHNSTRSQPETLYNTILSNNISGTIMFKDADSYFEGVMLPENSVCVYSLDSLRSVNPQNKSYVNVDDMYYIKNIIEKKIIGPFFCAGGYIFENASDFVRIYESLEFDSPLYISHLIYSDLLNGSYFRPIVIQKYQDWGTQEDYLRYLQKTAVWVNN